MANEHSIFVSYRKADGSSIATCIFHELAGQSIQVNPGLSVTLSFQIDRAIPGGADWKKYLDVELAIASNIIIVCSRLGMNKYPHRKDYYHHELEWWAKHRRHIRPILVAAREHGNKYVPAIVNETWKRLQVAEIEGNWLREPEKPEGKRCLAIFLESISRGIIDPLVSNNTKLITKPDHMPISNNEGVYAWEKDRHGKYIYVTEDYARAANADSPSAMYGKTDESMYWWSLAAKFREGDEQIMKGNEQSRMGVFEKEIMVDRVADILVTEGVIRDHSGRITGVRGSFLDVSKGIENAINRQLKIDETGIQLGPQFDHVHLDHLETAVLIRLLKLVPLEKVARSLDKKLSDVKGILQTMQQKLQCSNYDEILIAAIRAGLPLELLVTKHFNKSRAYENRNRP